MKYKHNKVIAFPHPPQKHGGPGSFQIRLEAALKKESWKVVYAEDEIKPDVILVVGGTKKHKWLKECKKSGVKIVHRLDGMNWLHRVKKMPIKQKVLCEVRNKMTARIRRKYADHIIYQSQFVKNWWEEVSGPVNVDSSIIHNAVNLNEFCVKEGGKPQNVICVEGNIDYTPFALEMLNFLTLELDKEGISLNVYGLLENESSKSKYPEINFMGALSRSNIHKVYNRAVFLSLDINAACPNTVIEALASGCPVVGYDTGALKELVGPAGIISEYNFDPWSLERPDFREILASIKEVIKGFDEYQSIARDLAIKKYDFDDLMKKYIHIIQG